MTIELRPEMEALIQKRLESGVYATPQEVIERALEFLAVEEDWLTANRGEIAAQIQEGWAEAERGELMDGDDVRADMAKQKQAWLQHRQA
jgi:Arc/MetJ-type ribon-helix-helix transcriptional regulator